MAAVEVFADQPSATVPAGAGAPAAGTQETWTVGGAYTSFPGANSSGTPLTQFHVVDSNPAGQSEIIAVINTSLSTWTVIRGAEGTTPVAHSAGFSVVQVVTSGWLGTVATTNSGAPYQFFLNAFGAKGDGKMITDLVLNGTTTATSASAGFTSGDTGKHMLIAGGAGSNAALHVTITFVNATTVTLSSAASISGTVPALYGTDDTAAVNSTVQAAMAYAAANPGNYAEVTGPPLIYCLAAATTMTTSGSLPLHFNSQIPLTPVVSAAAQKITLAFNFGSGGVTGPIFTQSIPQAAGGATFASFLTGQVVDATYGAPSVIGGPTDGGTSSTATHWTNICPVIKGLTILVPLNPTMSGLHLLGCATADVGNYCYLPFDTISNINAVKPTHSWVAGLYMPALLNNDEAFIGQVAVYGAYYGGALYTHVSAQTIKVGCCGYGVFIGAGSVDNHGLNISYISAEANGTALQCNTGVAGIHLPVNIGLLDIEAVGHYSGFGSNHIQDSNNELGGHINVMDNSGNASVLSISGGGNCEIICANQPRGHVTSPSVPAASATITNPFWRHALVVVSGDATANITIDGTATGVSSGAVVVPAGKTVGLGGYSGSPAWTWWLLLPG